MFYSSVNQEGKLQLLFHLEITKDYLVMELCLWYVSLKLNMVAKTFLLVYIQRTLCSYYNYLLSTGVKCQAGGPLAHPVTIGTDFTLPYLNLLFVWFDRPGESSHEKDCCW